MGRTSNYRHQPVFDNTDNSNNDNNTSCLDSKSQINDENLTFDYVKKKIRILQNSIESDLSELSLLTVSINHSDDYNFNDKSNHSNFDNNNNKTIDWKKINGIKMQIESDISMASSYLYKVKSNLSPSDHAQVLRYSDIFDQYRKDFNSIISNAEKQTHNNMFSNNINTMDNLSNDESDILFQQNKALNHSLYDVESLTQEALSILNMSKQSNERFVRIRNKMYSIIDMHLPDVDMIQKNIMHIAVRNQRIIAATIATCIFLITLTIFR